MYRFYKLVSISVLSIFASSASSVGANLTSADFSVERCHRALRAPHYEDYNLEPIHISIHRHQKLNDDIAKAFPHIAIEDLQQPLLPLPFDPDRPKDGGGGLSDSYISQFNGQRVHIKKNRFFETHEIEIQKEMSQRNLTPRFLGLTKVDQQKIFAVVSELVEPIALFKTLTTDSEREAQNKILQEADFAVSTCSNCIEKWINKIIVLRDFLFSNHIYVYDPQIMLMANGHVYLYDFDLYTFHSTSNIAVEHTKDQFNHMIGALKLAEERILSSVEKK